MKRVSKNLTKAVTLSVLLMLPYGMAWAKTYTDVISGANDKYTDEIKKYDEDTNTYIYDFSKDDDAKLDVLDVTATESYDRAISVEDSSIKIKGQLDVTVRADKEGGRYGYYPNGAVYVSGNNLLFDRRDGGTITQIDGNDSAVNIYGQGNAIYLGNGNIEQTINNDSNSINDVAGIEIYSGNNNLVVYGEDTIKTTAIQNEEDSSAGYNRINGVEIDGNASENNKIILGYKGSYDDLNEFTQANLAEKVKQLGAVTIYLTAENTCKDNDREARVTGIANGAENGNIIAGGDITIIAKASGYTIKDDDDSISAAGVYMSGMENNNIIAANKFMITAEAESKSDGMVSAIGMNTFGSVKNTINYVNAFGDGSNITATATGNMLTVNGISAHEALLMKIPNGYGQEYIIYNKYGDVEVNIGTIDITTTTNNGTDIENIGIRANGGTVNINGDAGIKVYVNNAADTNSDVFGIWSNLGGTVNVEGAANITINDDRLDAKKIAVVAGTRDLDENGKPFGEQNTVNLNYHKGGVSVINGDILSGYNGLLNVGTDTTTLSQRSTAGTLTLNGNALAGNGGMLNINLTAGSTWTGRADDYQDADTDDWDAAHSAQFAPQFSNEVTSSGNVNVTLAEGATWNVTGQSWITTLEGNGVVDLTKDEGSDAVHIGTVKGKNTFVVNLKPDGLDTSDMIYVKNGTNEAQTLQINNRDEVLSGMKAGDALRFATVTKAGEGFGNITDGAETFGKSTSINDAGIFNVDFDIIYKDYNEKMEGDLGTDQTYNGGNFSTNKPGQDYVDNVYGGKKDTSEINTLEETTETESNPKHVYIVRNSVTKENQSDAGKTIINMSRANYKNAIYMDRLNKRMGEMRYVNGEEEQGLWVRLRHDRIGQSGDFRSMNTMYEVGYDVKQPTDNGEHRIGMAIDYMRGSTTYDDIMGKGETKRYGLWLYDTWLGEKGHYVDYVAKWGHLSNDFDITAKTTGEKINGDYSNNVFSVSAEYGKKNDMGNNWYFEPQAQLQLARVTGADYVTTQGSKVNVDGINSLIGRAGFRIGRDMDENSTVYLKADLLHEFMGDQTVTAADATGTLREEFENKGTWYDVGFGFATKMSKNSYAFMDFEKSFGNDNDETYQINAGMQWSF